MNKMTTPEIPQDDRGRPIYSPEQIAAYKAVMAYEVRRRGGALADDSEVSLLCSMPTAGGVNGKSALLHRIAQGKKPLVIPPPLAMSYPWYDVIDTDGPWDVVIDVDTVDEMVALGQRLLQAYEEDASQPVVIINQTLWPVVRRVSDTVVEVASDEWRARGFLWQLTLDVIPAAQSTRCILAHHDPSLGRITTLEQLRAEERWHVAQRLRHLQIAQDPEASAQALEQARQRDAEANAQFHGGFASKFHEATVQSRLDAGRAEIAKRLQQGLSAIPEGEEVERLCEQGLQQYLSPGETKGFGWYSVDEQGQLLLHAWRLHRISPAQPDESTFLDVQALLAVPTTG